MAGPGMTADEALSNARLNKHRDWNRSSSSSLRSTFADDASARIFDGFASVVPEPPEGSYSLATPVFAMGSCFAREVESALVKRGGNVISVDDSLMIPAFERVSGKGASGYFHRFTPHAMLLEFQRAFGEAAGWCDDTLIVSSSGQYVDLNYYHTDDLAQKDFEAALSRRRVATALVRKVVDADIVVLTLGLTESFVHLPTQSHVNRVPPGYLARHKSDFALHHCTADEAFGVLEAIHGLIARHRSTPFEMVVTVSPVPLTSTFTTKDIIVANMDSKSTLRSAAGRFCNDRAGVHYFPSYEIVNYSKADLAWRPDRLHIQKPMVAHIVETFVRTYLSGKANDAAVAA